VVTALARRVCVDWTRGLLIAEGARAADLGAATPALARVAAERAARTAAGAALRQAVLELPTADGRPLRAVLRKQDGLQRRLEAELVQALDLEIDYASDGSVVLRAGLPIEAVRALLAGAPLTAIAADPPVTALVVDATGVLAAPALGVTLHLGEESYAGPTVYHIQLEAAQRDPRLGPRPHLVRARRRRKGGVELEGTAGFGVEALRAARAAGALVVIVIRARQGGQ
jgi:hypothetical protein